MDELEGYLRPLLPALNRLDNKEKNTTQPAIEQDVIQFLRTVLENVEMERCIREGFNAAGPVFSVAIQLMALTTLMNCPAEFAEKCNRTTNNESL